jgi:hypothetical protein
MSSRLGIKKHEILRNAKRQISLDHEFRPSKAGLHRIRSLPGMAGPPRSARRRRAEGGRVFDALMALIEVPGVVVSRDALKARAWPNRTVEDNNLAAQMLRCAKRWGWSTG